MILYVLKKNKNSKSAAYGKYFAYPVIEQTIDLDDLAEHMSSHNTPYSKGTIKGMLTDMVGCIKELLLEGKNVKIADLAIFSLGIKNNSGAASEEAFSVTKNIRGVKLRARATGELLAKSLNLDATLKKASVTTKKASNGGGTSGGGSTSGETTGGSSSTSGTGSITSDTGSGSGTGGSQSSGSQDSGDSGSEQNQEGDYSLKIYKYGNGTSTVTDAEGQAINSDDNVHSGTTVNISVVPTAGSVPTAKVGSNAITLTENDGTYTGSFQMPASNSVLQIYSEEVSNGVD